MYHTLRKDVLCILESGALQNDAYCIDVRVGDMTVALRTSA